MARGIVDIEQDLQDPMRQDFDKTVLRAYGIEKYFDTIVNNLRSMRHIRKTVKQNVVMLRQESETEQHVPSNEMFIGFAADRGVEN
jgi:hypothetical protein